MRVAARGARARRSVTGKSATPRSRSILRNSGWSEVNRPFDSTKSVALSNSSISACVEAGALGSAGGAGGRRSVPRSSTAWRTCHDPYAAGLSTPAV